MKRVLKPICKVISDDINTPVTAFLKVASEGSFLLESVSGGENVARYSFIGIDPMTEYRVESDNPEGDDPIEGLKILHNMFEIADMPSNVPPFAGGAVGYFAWEVMSAIERIEFKEKNGNPFPLAHFVFPQIILAFDHAKRNISIVAFAEDDQEDYITERIQELEAQLREPIIVPAISDPVNASTVYEHARCNTTQSEYEAAVKKGKAHIHDGDIFQIVLSQKFQVDKKKHPFDVYRTLRNINPSPYMFYFQFDDYQIIGSSPEILTSLNGRKAAVRPIAGTRPRQAENEDAVIQDLLSDEKEVAEHIMLVDLGRNDLGRVCDYESVKTTELQVIEKYSHVMHIVSHVEGSLKEGKDAFDLFRATFPAGTLSGAPKIRAIEIIEALENDRRGPYGGALGYIDFRGNMDLCIIIRTIFASEDAYHIQAGAGVVADSNPTNEHLECQNKARGVIMACLEGDGDE